MTLDSQIQKSIATYIWGKTGSSAAFATATTAIEYFNGGFTDLIVKKTPIIGITLIEDLIATATATVTSTTYAFDPEVGTIYRKSGNVWGDKTDRRRYAVTYTYGFTSIPEDIQLAIDTWTAAITADTTGSRTGYSTGDDSESYAAAAVAEGMPINVKKILNAYKRLLF